MGVTTYLLLNLTRRQRRSRHSKNARDDDNKVNNNSNHSLSSSEDRALRALFDEAVAASTLLDSGVTNGDKLMLYGLYKQATMGDVPSDAATPPVFHVVAYAKHSTWCKFRGMSQSAAMIHYMQAVKELQQQNGVLRSDDGHSLASSISSSTSHTDFDGPSSGMGMQPSTPIDEEDNAEPEMDANSVDAKLRNAAATAGVLEMKAWIEQGADLNAADDNGETALHFCADRGMVDGVVYLLELGANPNAADQDGISVLQAAVIAGHVDICKILLEAGADPDHEDADGDTPRSCASEDQSEKMISLFANYK